MRMEEGEILKQDMVERLDLIKEMIEHIEARKDAVVEDYASRLKERVRLLTEGIDIDEQRLLVEVAVMADRSDVTEELVRARSHGAQFREIIEQQGPVGRKLDFLVQELNREVNTIGSKANNAEISQSVVAIKSELEKIREQIQNVE